LSSADFPLSFIPEPGFFGFDSLTFIANDGAMDSEPAPVSIEVNARPTVRLLGPAEGSAFLTPATVEMTVGAEDPDGTVESVLFYAGEELIGEATQELFAFIWEDIPPGIHDIWAVATDDRGATL